MKKVSFKISRESDREKILMALGEAGYSVRTVEKQIYFEKEKYIEVLVNDPEVSEVKE